MIESIHQHDGRRTFWQSLALIQPGRPGGGNDTVDAGRDRREAMSRATLERCLEVVASNDIPIVDFTGGAPEIHPDFRWLVERTRGLGRKVINRCNLTILEYPAYRDLPTFFAGHEVELVCSLPHSRSLLTDRQRGEGTFERSLSALRRLNEVGYGKAGSGLRPALEMVRVVEPHSNSRQLAATVSSTSSVLPPKAILVIASAKPAAC